MCIIPENRVSAPKTYAKNVIVVTEASNHSNALIFNAIQTCDWVIGKKATIWGYRERWLKAIDDRAGYGRLNKNNHPDALM